jgi:hypothetical protein
MLISAPSATFLGSGLLQKPFPTPRVGTMSAMWPRVVWWVAARPLSSGDCRGAGPRRPRRRRPSLLLSVLGGVTQDEEVALGALRIDKDSVFEDHSQFKGFLLANGPSQPCTPCSIFNARAAQLATFLLDQEIQPVFDEFSEHRC